MNKDFQGECITVSARFIIYTTGKIGSIKITTTDPAANLGEDYTRLLTLSNGSWEPATIKGKKANSYKIQRLTVMLEGQ